MRWQLSGAEGVLAGRPLAEVLACGGVLNDAPLPARVDASRIHAPETLADRLAPLWRKDRYNWLILPDTQRPARTYWESYTGEGPDAGFGRAQVVLALRQMASLGQPARLLAVDRVASGEGWTDSVLALDWEPAERGLALLWSQLDGRLDGKTDVGALLEQASGRVSRPGVIVCPGTASDNTLERLLPFLTSLGPWTVPSVRWEFAESRVGPLGVVGALYSWFWLQEGFQFGEWQGPAAVMDMDQSPLVGVSLVDYC